MGFFVCMKREGDEKGTAEQSEGKNHPVNGFLVPRAGGGTAPVPPDESPYLHHQESPEFLGFLLILGLLCPQNPTKRFHTKFHFEFHSFKEETLFIATPQSHFVRQLPGRGAFWHCASTNYKPALKGEVDMSASEWTEGLKKKDASLVYVNPSVTT